MGVTQMYLKMKNAKGNAVWRNIAPQYKGDKLTLRQPLQTATQKQLIAGFLPIQTEELYVDDDKFSVKIVTEEISDINLSSAFVNPDYTVPGGDAWEDTTNEKYVVDFTDGEYSYGVKLPNAATEVNSGTLVAAVTRYCTAIQDGYLSYQDEAPMWTQAHLTGTKDSLVAQNE